MQNSSDKLSFPADFSSEVLQSIIDNKTKPPGSLGELERLALRLGKIQHTNSPVLRHPAIFVFAADHGIAGHSVSAYPSEVTAQMVLNFTRGGAAINVFCRQHQIGLKVVNAGVAYDFPSGLDIINASVGKGTASFLTGPAMSKEQCLEAFANGQIIVDEWADNFAFNDSPTVIGFGEMGIGNTSAAAMLMHRLTGIPVEDCVGRGTGVDDEGLLKKKYLLNLAAKNAVKAGLSKDAMKELAWFGGFEIAMMVGAMTEAATRRMVLLVDGFISTVAFLVASRLMPSIRNSAIFCHCSDEHGHRALLDFFNERPLLQLSLRLGEGTGCALAYPLLKSATAFLEEMASFESAGISGPV